MKSLDEQYQDALIVSELISIRGALIKMKRHLERVKIALPNPTYDEYTKLGAIRQCLICLTRPYSELGWSVQETVREYQNKIEEYITSLSPEYTLHPAEALIALTGNGSIQRVIDYINRLDDVVCSTMREFQNE